MQRTKCGLACTRVRRRLSSRVWKSCVSVDTGSSPFSSWFSRFDAVDAGEMRKLQKISEFEKKIF
jgi:hypothetical protein